MAVFSIDYGEITNCLPINVIITNPKLLKGGEFSVIWDTGATNTVISRHVFNALNLIDTDDTRSLSDFTKAFCFLVRLL